MDNHFSLLLEIFGSLREGQFVCPSHQVTLLKSADKVVISLQQAKVVMDRDFILNVRAPQATRSFALCGSDGDGLAAVAGFQPFFSGLQQPRPLNLAIVIDCSGSMQGDSMEQAKQALEGILDALQANDQVTLIAFGNATNALSDRLLPCNKTNLGKAKQFAKKLDANMGGTEIRGALQVAYKTVGASESVDIFLVTDGEVSSWEAVVKEAKGSGHRIFTVGVGSAVSEAFVRGLATGTGGECELVSPQEGMADRVIRHFERMRAPRAKRVDVHWPEGAHGVTPSKLGAVFEGDTVIACARFDMPSISGSVVLEVETEKGDVTRQELPISIAPQSGASDRLSTVARLAAAARLKEVNDATGLETALRYRLVSPWTNWLVVAERPEGEQAQDIPELRKVPQTLAAGWGGVGQVLACSAADRSVDCLMMDAMPAVIRKSRASTIEALQQIGVDKYDIPAFLRKQADAEALHPLLALIEADPSRLDSMRALDLLNEAGIAPEFHDLFQHATDLGLNVDVIAAIVLAELLRGPLGEYLSTGTQNALAALQDYAKQATEALREMGRYGIALAKAVRGNLAREVLRPGQAQAVEEALERLARFRDLLEHLHDSVRKSSERLEIFQAARVRRGSGIIA